MTYLLLKVHGTDGSCRTLVRWPDDPMGRARIDKAAFSAMARDSVAYCSVERVTFSRRGWTV